MKTRRLFSRTIQALIQLGKSRKQRSDEAAGQILSPTESFPEAEYIKQKRAEAIAALGEGWILHPNYKSTPRHSNHLHIWWPHRTLKGAVAH